MEGEEKKREGEKDAHRHAHRNAWLVSNIFYTLRASVKTAQVSLQKQPTQLVRTVVRVGFRSSSALTTGHS